jgi:hypothetical protein
MFGRWAGVGNLIPLPPTKSLPNLTLKQLRMGLYQIKIFIQFQSSLLFIEDSNLLGPAPTGTMALDPTLGSFTLLEPISHSVNWFLWWKCLDCLNGNGFFWCSECEHSKVDVQHFIYWQGQHICAALFLKEPSIFVMTKNFQTFLWVLLGLIRLLWFSVIHIN